MNIQEAINKNKLKKIAKNLGKAARKDKKIQFIRDELNAGKLPKKEILALRGESQDEVVMAFVQEVGPEEMIKTLNIKLKEQMENEACWDGYKQAGMKKKKGKMVPNCVPEEKVGAECSCCGGKIDKDGKCGCGPECKHCGGQHDVQEAKYSVDVEGIPRFYVDADSPGKVKIALRKLLKRDSLIKDVDRTTDSKVKQDYRQRIAQEEVEEMAEQYVVKYAKNKRGPIYQTKFKTQPEAEKFLDQKRKEGMNGIVSKAGKPVSMQKFKDLQKEEVELDEATVKDIKDILTTIGSSKNMNQAVQMVMKKYKVDQGKAKAMVKKAIDSGVTYDKIKKKYRKESVEQIDEKMNTIDIARSVVKNKSAKHGLDMQTANLILKVYDKVNDKNKKKMETMAPAALGRAVWKMTGK